MENFNTIFLMIHVALFTLDHVASTQYLKYFRTRESFGRSLRIKQQNHKEMNSIK